MISCEPEKLFTLIPEFETTANKISRSIHETIMQREETRQIADVLHGTWMGHPLHPALTDFVVGAWVLGTIFDSISCLRPSHSTDKAADLLISLGNAAALPTALAGMADFSTAPKKTVPAAAAHALINVGGLLMNLVSSSRRRSGRRGSGRCLSATASSLLLVSAWLGGKLVYDQKVGVNKIPETDGANEWKSIGHEKEFQDNVPKRVDVAGAPVVACRCGTEIAAIGAVCGHEGGPLDKGKVEGTRITCPWHQSVYDLKDGRVIHGPSTYPEPVYETRVKEDQVELRRCQTPAVT